MGDAMSKRCAELREESRLRSAIIHALEEEIRETRRERDREARTRERQEAALAAKQAEWTRERRLHKEEVGTLRKKLQEEEDRRRLLEDEYSALAAAAVAGGDGVDEELRQLGATPGRAHEGGAGTEGADSGEVEAGLLRHEDRARRPHPLHEVNAVMAPPRVCSYSSRMLHRILKLKQFLIRNSSRKKCSGFGCVFVYI